MFQPLVSMANPGPRPISTRIVKPGFLALGLLLGAAGAGPARAGDPAAAEVLFRQGRALIEAGKVPEACAKFAESQRLDPSSGTLLNLADCHEKEGKIASAWAEFLAAATLSRSQHNEPRAAEATSRAQALKGRLSYLTIRVREPVEGQQVRRGEVVLEAASLGGPLPVDPGLHVIAASAPGREVWSTRVQLAPDGDRKVIEIPPLTRVQAPPAASSSAPVAPASATASAIASASAPEVSSAPVAVAPEVTSSMRRPLGYALGGAGAVALVVGGYFGLRALSTYDQAESRCMSHRGCSAEAMDLREQAGTRARISDVSLGVGLLLAGAGGYLLLVKPSGSQVAGGLVVGDFVGGGLRGRF